MEFRIAGLNNDLALGIHIKVDKGNGREPVNRDAYGLISLAAFKHYHHLFPFHLF